MAGQVAGPDRNHSAKHAKRRFTSDEKKRQIGRVDGRSRIPSLALAAIKSALFSRSRGRSLPEKRRHKKGGARRPGRLGVSRLKNPPGTAGSTCRHCRLPAEAGATVWAEGIHA